MRHRGAAPSRTHRRQDPARTPAHGRTARTARHLTRPDPPRPQNWEREVEAMAARRALRHRHPVWNEPAVTPTEQRSAHHWRPDVCTVLRSALMVRAGLWWRGYGSRARLVPPPAQQHHPLPAVGQRPRRGSPGGDPHHRRAGDPRGDSSARAGRDGCESAPAQGGRRRTRRAPVPRTDLGAIDPAASATPPFGRVADFREPPCVASVCNVGWPAAAQGQTWNSRSARRRTSPSRGRTSLSASVSAGFANASLRRTTSRNVVSASLSPKERAGRATPTGTS